MIRITLIGAGSTVFTKRLVGDILLTPELGSRVEIMLHDIDTERRNIYSKNFHFSQHASLPVILREAEWRSRRIHHRKNNPRPPREGGPSQTMGEGRGRALSSTPHPTWRGTLHREKVFYPKRGSGFCNSGKALRAK